MQDEREERELRKVEMQTQKAENMIEHEAEIYARPPRTWFQTGSLLHILTAPMVGKLTTGLCHCL